MAKHSYTPTRRRGATATALALSAIGVAPAVGVAPTVAHADSANHYYIEIGGTGGGADAPNCTVSYNNANQHLNGGTPVPVCYPASAGPWIGSHNEQPALTAPNFDDSVHAGYQNALAALENTYHRDPNARFTITGYSQGAWVGDLLLQTVANNGTDIPRGQVDGMLYADPMQPGTGVWNLVPKGVYLPLVATSPGTGPAEFPGVPVKRFCIHTDGICDATSLQSIGGFFVQHPLYPQPGGIMSQTLASDGGDGTAWYPAA
jgi:hypothetical protein